MLNRDHISDALRFWEPARIPYNLLLVILTAVMIGPSIMTGVLPFGFVSVPSLIILAALANIAYCMSYPIDLFVQASAFREQRRVWRIGLWSAGAILAAALTWLTAGAIANSTAW